MDDSVYACTSSNSFLHGCYVVATHCFNKEHIHISLVLVHVLSLQLLAMLLVVHGYAGVDVQQVSVSFVTPESPYGTRFV